MTFSEMVEAVGRDMGLDLSPGHETGVTGTRDVKRFINQGQRLLSQKIIGIKEDYFLTYHDIDVAGSSEEWQFDLPEGIYANKVRKVTFEYSGYNEVLPPVGFNEFVDLSSDSITKGTYPWGYFILEGSTGSSVGAAKMAVVPRRSFSGVSKLRIYYLRSPKELVEDSDMPDLPGSADCLVEYAKWKAAQVDPQRSADLYLASYRDLEMSFLESYTDRTPEEGGDKLRVSDDTASNYMQPTGWL